MRESMNTAGSCQAGGHASFMQSWAMISACSAWSLLSSSQTCFQMTCAISSWSTLCSTRAHQGYTLRKALFCPPRSFAFQSLGDAEHLAHTTSINIDQNITRVSLPLVAHVMVFLRAMGLCLDCLSYFNVTNPDTACEICHDEEHGHRRRVGDSHAMSHAGHGRVRAKKLAKPSAAHDVGCHQACY